jgi:hypothetical protein
MGNSMGCFLTQNFFLLIQDNKRSFLCVLGVSNLRLFLRFCDWNLNCFRKCDIFFIILQTDPLQVSEISMNLLQMREH